MPFGCELTGAGAHFRFFAPAAPQVKLELDGSPQLRGMEPSGNGWHQLLIPDAPAGMRYRFVLPDGTRVPDPVSRFQPASRFQPDDDLTGPSEIIDPCAYVWSDARWRGRPWSEAILYELHIGAFSPEGTFLGAIEKLPHLADLGITGIELMALADFPGARNWGYDGVLLYAPDSVYGRPEDLKALVNAAHARGIMVLLDVVYNHLGAQANLIPRYWPQFLSPIHDTPWGKPPNFDADGAREVREFIIHNALYWIEEFHIDGLRLDASHDMRDASQLHILDELADRIHTAAGAHGSEPGREVHLILEDEHNASARLLRDLNGKPTVCSAQWNHHMAHLRELASETETARQGGLAKLTETIARMVAIGFADPDTPGAPFMREAHEWDSDATTPGRHEWDPTRVPPTAYISFLQTHDLVGNDLTGERTYAKLPLRINRALSVIYLLVPQIPMLFMGDEWGASTPFQFFCDFPGDMAEKIRKGRREFLKKELHLQDSDLDRMPDPLAPEAFLVSHLNWNELTEPIHADWLQWYRRILAVRRDHLTPLLRAVCDRRGDYEIRGPGAFTAGWSLAPHTRLTLDANLYDSPNDTFAPPEGNTLWLEGESPNPTTLAPWSVRFALTR
jgi:maltooligosyltrehalose trehalohydrolase